jgi:hypothetical protein
MASLYINKADLPVEKPGEPTLAIFKSGGNGSSSLSPSLYERSAQFISKDKSINGANVVPF